MERQYQLTQNGIENMNLKITSGKIHVNVFKKEKKSFADILRKRNS